MNAWRYTDLLADGMSPGQIAAASRVGALRRVVRGVYVEDGRHRSLIADLKALFLILPAGAVVAFHTAAQLLGFGVVRDRHLHLALPSGSRLPDIKGVRSHQVALAIGEPIDIAGLPCMPPARTAVDLARVCQRPDALAVLDAALRTGACTRGALTAEILRHDGLRGVRQARETVRMADPRAECRQESHLRLIVMDAGLPAPEPQLLVEDDWGSGRYRLDLGWRERRIGAEHDRRGRLQIDRERHKWLASRGWSVRHFTDADIYGQPTHVAAAMRSALA